MESFVTVSLGLRFAIDNDPQLRCEHRDRAWSVVQRYQRKIDEIKATNRHEAYRLQRVS